MKILVFMSDNRTVSTEIHSADYNSLAAAINYEYSKKHGYAFLYYRPYLHNKNTLELQNCLNPTTNRPRHASWSKLLSTYYALQGDYDYIVYIDSDCIFSNHSIKLEDYIQPYQDKSVLFLKNFPWSETDPCAGFIICRVDSIAKQFIQEWYSYDIPEKDANHDWEQSALHRMMPREYIGIIDDIMFQEKDGQLLRHIGSHEGGNRIPTFKTYIQTHGIDFPRAILAIQYKDYSTKPTKTGRYLPLRRLTRRQRQSR